LHARALPVICIDARHAPFESGEVSHNGRISKDGSGLTRKHLYEAATTLVTRTTRFSRLQAWGLRLAKSSGFKTARVAVARKPAVILHAMWKTQTPFRWGEGCGVIGSDLMILST
jgi:hypothetical protein